eukprot:gene9665-1872_t
MNEKLLQTQHWKKLPISKETDHYYKFVSTSNGYTIIITDLMRVFHNHSNEEEISKEMKVFCPNISMSTFDLINVIDEQFVSLPLDSTFDLDTEKKDEVIVLLKSTLELEANVSLPFNWEVKCTLMEESAKFIKENVIDPLLSITFLYDNEKIEKLIENPKDLTKGNLELPTFQQILFENYMNMIEKTNNEKSQQKTQEKNFEIPYEFDNFVGPNDSVLDQTPLSLNSSGSKKEKLKRN